jgi:hypothetical protein
MRSMFALLSMCLAACGDKSSITDPLLAEGIPREAREIAISVWPLVLQACPGLITYSTELQPRRDLSSFNELTGRVDVGFHVSDSSTRLPARYWGHNCHFAFDGATGASVEIAKSPCASICLGRDVKPADTPIVLKLY